jgi:hypothetical protein
MADIIDVANALTNVVRQAVYPMGTAQPPVAGELVHVFTGWPIPGNMQVDIKAGNANIAVFPAGAEENLTRFPQAWQVVASPAITLVITIHGNNATLSGATSTPQTIALIANNKAYAYAVQASDTLTSIMTALAGMIAVDHPGVASSGAVLTVPSGVALTAGTVGGQAEATREVRRQRKEFTVTIWSPTQPIRDALGAAIDVALAQFEYLTLVDGSMARIRYASTFLNDSAAKVGLFRREISYRIEYPTLQFQQIPTITAITETVSGGIDPTSPLLASISQ